MTKIAFVTFHNDDSSLKVGGIVTGPVYLVENLRKVMGAQVDLYAVADVGKGKKAKIKNKAFEGQLTHMAFFGIENTGLDKLNEYDMVLFMSPGKTYEKHSAQNEGRYKFALDQLNVPFGFIVNEERDRTIYPYYTEFTEHPGCKFVLFNSEDMAKDFEDFLVNEKIAIEFQFLAPLEPLEIIIERAEKKTSSIINTGRWTNRKRIMEFVELAPKFKEEGLEVFLAGAKQNPFYSKKVDELLVNEGYEQYLTYIGDYKPTEEELDNLLLDKMFHYNFIFLKIKSRVMYRRLEIATFEAFNRGCLPVICQETSPEWAKSAVVVSKNDLESIPTILAELSHDDRIQMIKDFYKEIVENVECRYLGLFTGLFEKLGVVSK